MKHILSALVILGVLALSDGASVIIVSDGLSFPES